MRCVTALRRRLVWPPPRWPAVSAGVAEWRGFLPQYTGVCFDGSKNRGMGISLRACTCAGSLNNSWYVCTHSVPFTFTFSRSVFIFLLSSQYLFLHLYTPHLVPHCFSLSHSPSGFSRSHLFFCFFFLQPRWSICHLEFKFSRRQLQWQGGVIHVSCLHQCTHSHVWHIHCYTAKDCEYFIGGNCWGIHRCNKKAIKATNGSILYVCTGSTVHDSSLQT